MLRGVAGITQWRPLRKEGEPSTSCLKMAIATSRILF